MSLVRLENVSKYFGTQPVLQGVDLRIEEGEKVGLIGRNGTGKSTIFRIITGETAPDGGVVEIQRRTRIACLRQIPDFGTGQTVMDVVTAAFQDLIDLETRVRDLEHRMAEGDHDVLEEYGHAQDEFTVRGGYEFRARIEQVLSGLGFTSDEFILDAQALSGGQKTRLMVAIVLLEEAGLLLLDEPENHLDLDAREWLESYLKERREAFIVISHDRRLLNAVTERTVELERGVLRSYAGNYDAFHEQKALIREQQQKEYERQQRFIDKEQKWIDRFRAKATKAKAVQSRIKQLDRLERVEAPQSEAARLKLHTGDVVRSGHVVLSAHKLGKAYDPLRLYEDVTFQVERGERLGILGPNGAGKTTLLRQLAGKLEGAGEVRLGHKVRIGYYDQMHDDLNVSNDVLTEVQRVKPSYTPERIRTYLGRFLFTGEDVFKPVSALSGGERSRVVLAKLILADANLLLLDEPTNHLDIASREVLEEALAAFQGTIILISHDRTLIDTLVDKLLIIEDGHARVHLGNYSHYRWKQGEADRLAEEQRQRDAMKIRRNRPEKPKPARGNVQEQRKQKKRLNELETEITATEARITGLEEAFTQLDPADFEKAHALKEEYEKLKDLLEEYYLEWADLSEKIAE